MGWDKDKDITHQLLSWINILDLWKINFIYCQYILGSEKQRQKMNQHFSTLTFPRPKFSPLIWIPLSRGAQECDGGCSQSIPAPLGLSSLLTLLPVPVQALSCNKVNISSKLQPDPALGGNRCCHTARGAWDCLSSASYPVSFPSTCCAFRSCQFWRCTFLTCQVTHGDWQMPNSHAVCLSPGSCVTQEEGGRQKDLSPAPPPTDQGHFRASRRYFFTFLSES